jgi:hypothetical protein
MTCSGSDCFLSFLVCGRRGLYWPSDATNDGRPFFFFSLSLSLSRLLSDYSNAHKEPPDAPLPLSRQSKTNQLFFFFRLSADCAELPSCSLSDRLFPCWARSIRRRRCPSSTTLKSKSAEMSCRPATPTVQGRESFRIFLLAFTGVTRTHFERPALYRLALAHCCLFEAP